MYIEDLSKLVQKDLFPSFRSLGKSFRNASDSFHSCLLITVYIGNQRQAPTCPRQSLYFQKTSTRWHFRVEGMIPASIANVFEMSFLFLEGITGALSHFKVLLLRKTLWAFVPLVSQISLPGMLGSRKLKSPGWQAGLALNGKWICQTKMEASGSTRVSNANEWKEHVSMLFPWSLDIAFIVICCNCMKL